MTNAKEGKGIITMTRYEIYNTDDQLKYVRKANSPKEALEKLCDQYGWSYRVSMYDADTQGKEWMKFLIDKNGGIDYNDYLIAVLPESK